MNSAAEAFSSATLEIVDDKVVAKSSKNNIHETRAYYSDSSGRARVHLRVRLAIPNKDTNTNDNSDGGLQALIDCKSIKPTPVEADCSIEVVSNEEKDLTTDEDGDKDNDWYTDSTCTFECTCISSSQKAAWALEGVTILHSEIERSNTKIITALLFNIEIAVRGNGIIKLSDMKEMLEDGTLELCAVLRQKEKYRRGVDDNVDESAHNNNVSSKKTALLGGRSGAGVAAGLLGLEYGGGATSPSIISQGLGSDVVLHYGTQILKTPSLQIRTTLVPPLQLTVREVCGARAASGSTLVEITVEHSSKWHKEDVTVTGIAFHPGQSRLYTASMEDNMREDDHRGDNESRTTAASSVTNNVSKPLEGKSMQGGELSVLDMSRRVRWGFAAGSAPDLPLVLEPYEAFATVIQIDAGEDVRSRAFLSPISVNAMIGSDIDLGNKDNQEEKCGERIMVTADTRWTSSRVGVENSDAFRIDMSLRGGLETTCRVGAPIVIQLRVLNLSMESRDLMLLMAKDGEGTDSGLQWERAADGRRRRAGRRDIGQQLLHQSNINNPQTKENHSFNTAVVSEVNGYTFGVWGLSGDDDGTTRHHRDHELLAVDAALLLGEVKGQHSIEAELRFVPLREGTLDVPNLKLYDKRQQRWYNCVHTLKIVAKQSD